MRRLLTIKRLRALAREAVGQLEVGPHVITVEANQQIRADVIVAFSRDGERHVTRGTAYLDAAFWGTANWRENPIRTLGQVAEADALRSLCPELARLRTADEPPELLAEICHRQELAVVA